MMAAVPLRGTWTWYLDWCWPEVDKKGVSVIQLTTGGCAGCCGNWSTRLCFCICMFPCTVPLLKSCHRRRSFFLITGGRNILHELGDHYSLFHQPPIKIFLLYAQKSGQMRQSNLPPLFSRRWSAAYWAEIWPADAVSIVTSISRLSNSYLSFWFSSYFLVYIHVWLFWTNLAIGKLAETATFVTDISCLSHHHLHNLKLPESCSNHHIHHQCVAYRRWADPLKGFTFSSSSKFF